MQIATVAQFMQYQQIDFLTDFWKSLSTNSQIFYDRGSEQFILKDQNNLYVSNKNSLNKIIRIRIPHKYFYIHDSDNLYSVNVQTDCRYIAYQTNINTIVSIYLFQTIFSIRANKWFQIKNDKFQNILLYEWTNGLRGQMDLIVVDTSGIRLYKVDEGAKEVKHISHKMTCAWYEPKNEVLVTDKLDNNGLLCTFFFSNKQKDYKFKGPEFYLDDFQPKENTGITSIFKSKTKNTNIIQVPSDKKNRNLLQEDRFIDSTYRIYLINNYGKPLIAYANSFSGKIIFYLLHSEKIDKQDYVLGFASDDAIQLSMVDNMIVFSALKVRISSLFDVKCKRAESSLIPPQSIIQKDLQVVRVKDVVRKKEQQDNQETNELQLTQSSNNQKQQEENAQVQKIVQDVNNQVVVQKTESQEEIEPQENEITQSDHRDQFSNNQQNQEEANRLTAQSVYYQTPLTEQEKQAQNDFLSKDDVNVNLFSDSANKQQQEQQDEPKTADLYFSHDILTLKDQMRENDNFYDTFIVRMKFITKEPDNQVNYLSKIYEDGCIYMEDDIIINIQTRQVFQFQFNLKYLPILFEDEFESFLALLRRKQSKITIFEYLIQLAEKKTQIQTFSKIYDQIFKNLIRALRENPINNQQIEYLKNGTTVIYPSEVQNNFFIIIVDNQNIPRSFTIQLIIEYIRQFQDNMKEYKQIPMGIQNILIKLLIKDQNFTYLHFLLQYQILNDTEDLARLLIDISSKEVLITRKIQSYEPAFQLGIDMLNRLNNKQQDILDILLKFGKLSEAAIFLRKNQTTLKIKLQSLQECLKSTNVSKSDIFLYINDMNNKGRLQFNINELKI